MPSPTARFSFRVAPLLIAVVVLPIARVCGDTDTYFQVPLNALRADGDHPIEITEANPNSKLAVSRPRVVIDGAGEGYIVKQNGKWLVTARGPQGADLQGMLVVPNPGQRDIAKFRFRIPADEGDQRWRTQYYYAMQDYYARLVDSDSTGSSWFAHRKRQAMRALGLKASETRASPSRPADRSGVFDFFTGRRAIDENLDLQADLLTISASESATVPISALRGITVAAIDWDDYLIDDEPTLDVLAKHIPRDRLAAFFPNVDQLVQLLQANSQFTCPISWSMRTETEDPRLVSRYLKQLCLPLDKLAASDLAASIDEIAIVSGDPYWHDGTDVAVVFQSERANKLRQWLLKARHSVGSETTSSHIKWVRDGAVVVSNSRPLAMEIARAKENSLAGLQEYRFFRKRYTKGADHETAFIVLTDPAIRKWCSPAWRIGQARRRQAGAVMAALQCKHIADEKLAGDVLPHNLLGFVTFPGDQIHSRKFGTLAHLRPISEMGMEGKNATTSEVRAYDQWRRRYEGEWRRFDPIAIQLKLEENKIATDLTVMPLRASSRYRSTINWTSHRDLERRDGDIHAGAMLHAIMPFSMPRFLSIETKYVEVFLDESPRWKKLASAQDALEYARSIDFDFPVAISVEFELKNTAWAIHDLVRSQMLLSQQPGTEWSGLTHRGVDFEHATLQWNERDKTCRSKIYLLLHESRLVATPNQVTMHAIIDRILDGPSHADLTEPAWDGNHLALKATAETSRVLSAFASTSLKDFVLKGSWSNIAILNEWKRLYPEENPVAVHERIWHTKPICLAGGEYIWNEEWQTMESTATGHPAQPVSPQHFGRLIPTFHSLNTGVTFEPEGLRAKAVVELRE